MQTVTLLSHSFRKWKLLGKPAKPVSNLMKEVFSLIDFFPSLMMNDIYSVVSPLSFTLFFFLKWALVFWQVTQKLTLEYV